MILEVLHKQRTSRRDRLTILTLKKEKSVISLFVGQNYGLLDLHIVGGPFKTGDTYVYLNLKRNILGYSHFFFFFFLREV